MLLADRPSVPAIDRGSCRYRKRLSVARSRELPGEQLLGILDQFLTSLAIRLLNFIGTLLKRYGA